MDQSARTYACIDLKSFYASVECADRGLDPMSTRLVVADPSRSRGTICLAVSPALRALGMPSRCRLFQVPAALHPVVAPPRMALYMETAADIYGIYLRHIAPEDMHVYSVDEVFLDLTQYLPYYGVSARELVRGLMDEVRREKGVYATAGIGPNLFVAKAALDVEAKHDLDCIAELDEESFRQRLWFHRPITDIWGIGPNIARRLAARDIHDLAGICAAPEADLYGEFGRNAEYLIDHAWGQEPVTMAQIKAHVPRSRSLCTGQVLPRPYSFAETRTVLREMAGDLALDLVEKAPWARAVPPRPPGVSGFHVAPAGGAGLHAGVAGAARPGAPRRRRGPGARRAAAVAVGGAPPVPRGGPAAAAPRGGRGDHGALPHGQRHPSALRGQRRGAGRVAARRGHGTRAALPDRGPPCLRVTTAAGRLSRASRPRRPPPPTWPATMPTVRRSSCPSPL